MRNIPLFVPCPTLMWVSGNFANGCGQIGWGRRVIVPQLAAQLASRNGSVHAREMKF